MLKTLANERQNIILSLLDQHLHIKVQTLVDTLGVSEATIRRDLTFLEENGHLTRVHGGARRTYEIDREPSLIEKSSLMIEAKQAIATYAASLIQPNDIIYLDAGTTTLALVPLLQDLSIRVVTNGLEQAHFLVKQGIETILLGGPVKSNTQAVVGTLAYEQLKTLRVNKAFLGMNGLHPTYGMMTPDQEEGIIKKQAIAQANLVYFLCDQTKFGKVSFVQVAPPDTGVVITDEIPMEGYTEYVEYFNIKEVSK